MHWVVWKLKLSHLMANCFCFFFPLGFLEFHMAYVADENGRGAIHAQSVMLKVAYLRP